jgi:hypothetical protein
MSAGTHTVVVRAWDSSGAYASQTLTLNVVQGVSVTVSTPANNATVSSPVNIKASAVSAHTITGWHIYVDSNDVYSAGQTTAINASIGMSAGTHTVVVRAWDSTGAYSSQTLTLNVTQSSGVSVNVSSPSTTNVASPLNVTASASSVNPITGWHIYVDGNDVYSAGAVTSIDTNLDIASGSHQMVVRAWDSTGAYGSQTLNLNVQSGGGGQTINGIDQFTNWINCTASKCGATNGGANYLWYTGQTAPDGTNPTTEFALTGGPAAYDGMYMYHQNASIDPNTTTHQINTLTYSFDLYMPSQYINTPQAIEFEVQQEEGGNLFNFAWQLDYGDMWQTQQMWLRLYNYQNGSWADSGLPKLARLSAGWHHISAAFHTVGTAIYHDSITVDGTTYTVPAPNNQTNAVSNGSQEFNNAVQLDLNGNAQAFTIYLKNMSLNYTLY